MVNRVKPVSKLGVTAGLVVLVLLLFGVSAQAQEKKPATAGAAAGKKEVVATKAQAGTAGTDANVKSDSEKNNPNMQAPAPPGKGGRKRGAGPIPCGLHIDNRTPWLARIYVDGNYRGTISQYGDLVGLTGNGPTSLYAVAPFDDGSEKTWGPRIFNCSAGSSYTWQLTP